MRDWDNKKYEDQLFYFNTRARPAVYAHDVQGSGLDHCYDCLSEITILKHWILKNEPDLSGERLSERVAEESLRISRSLDSQRTLESGNTDPGLRRSGIVQRQSIDGRPAYRVHTEARGFAVSEAVAAALHKRPEPDAMSLTPGKAQRESDSQHTPRAVSDHSTHNRDYSSVGSPEARYAARHHHGTDTAPAFPAESAVSDRRNPNAHSHPEFSRSAPLDHGRSEHPQPLPHQSVDELRNRDASNYRAQSSARFDVDKYSKMLGVSASAAVSSNYAITAGASSGSTRGLGFSAAGGASSGSAGRNNEHAREKTAAQASRPSNAHVFPEISCFRRWLSVYAYSRIMQGPSRFLDLSLRSLADVQDAVTYCKPSVYIHGHVGSSVHTGAFVAPTAQEQQELVNRFPSVVFRGFALNFSGKDGSAELAQLCSSCRTITQIDAVDVGLLAAQVVTSEAALIAILDSFHSVCAPYSVMQGRTNCSISDFTRFPRFCFDAKCTCCVISLLTRHARSLPLFASRGWQLLSWSAVERYAIKFRSSRKILPAALAQMREVEDQALFLMQSCPVDASVP